VEAAALRGALDRVLSPARAGRPEALEELDRLLRPFAEACVRRHLSARAERWIEVADVAQGVLLETLRALARLPQENGSEELLRWVRRSAKSRALDARRNHAGLFGESVTPLSPEARGSPTRSTGTVTAADRRLWLAEFVARLPARYAEVVRLCGLEGHSYVEAARQLGLEPDTVRKRYEVAGRELARRLQGHDLV
jgi:RNA polymerase sigma-70 factor (ECF subfamily)